MENLLIKRLNRHINQLQCMKLWILIQRTDCKEEQQITNDINETIINWIIDQITDNIKELLWCDNDICFKK